MKLLYLSGIYFYRAATAFAALFYPKARLRRQGLHQIFSRMKVAAGQNSAPVAWFHCASLGEFEQARPVIEGFRERFGHYKILLTFFSPSGYEIRKAWPGADYIFYLPDDTPANANSLYEIFKPETAFFVKYEFWYFYLRRLQQGGCTILSFSAIFRPSQVFFRPGAFGGSFFAGMLRRFTHFFVQNPESGALLNGLGINSHSLSGDTRFDRVAAIAENPKELKQAARFKNGKPLLLIGSAWPADTDALMPALNRLSDEMQVIIAPHEIEPEYIEQLRTTFKGPSVLWSGLGDSDPADYKLLIIDNIGMLSALYRYADIACVGGAFGKGLHNILEAAVFGIPVLFGPRCQKFKEAVDLVAVGGAFTFAEAAPLQVKLTYLLRHPQERAAAGAVCARYVQQHRGATQKIIDYCALHFLKG